VSRPVEVCRGLSSCRAVELDTLTRRRMESEGFCRGLSSSCRGLSSSCRAILSSSCRVACQVPVEFPVELSRPGLKPGDPPPHRGGAMGAVWGVLLRNYGFTPLPPPPASAPRSPLPRADPRSARTYESSYRR
jgi:hypothetical protein